MVFVLFWLSIWRLSLASALRVCYVSFIFWTVFTYVLPRFLDHLFTRFPISPIDWPSLSSPVHWPQKSAAHYGYNYLDLVLFLDPPAAGQCSCARPIRDPTDSLKVESRKSAAPHIICVCRKIA